MKQWNLKEQQVFYQQAPLTFSYLTQLMEKVPAKYRVRFLYPTYTPQYPVNWDPQESKIRQVLAADRLIYFPYDTLEPFLQLIKEASEDPAVISIKIAIYRWRTVLVSWNISYLQWNTARKFWYWWNYALALTKPTISTGPKFWKMEAAKLSTAWKTTKLTPKSA
jgi:hypothetical protein